ncbi:MAG: glycerate kinase [Rhodospirillales bacterium]|nr:glycerate kinase [Rhodospirillales bacterium]
MSGRPLLERLFRAAVDATAPARCVPPALPPPPAGRTVVVGAGKASAAMARAVEDHWAGPLSGLVVTRYGHAVACERIEIVEAAHPVPDDAGRRAAERILRMVGGLSADDLVLCLISGGGSALLSLPAPGIGAGDKRAVTQALLRSGATIAEMNCVRKHLSAIKGGRLAAACAPARVVALMISDVPGDDPAVIASGPTAADPSTFAEARAVLAKYGIEPSAAVREHLLRGTEETPKPGDPRLARVDNRLVATPQMALEAAAAVARQAGYAPLILGDAIEGEAREVAAAHAGVALQARRHGQPAPPPCVLLSGGETTVTVRGSGRGGRNTEFLLALALALEGAPGISALAADTDGIDGTEDNAGALVFPDTLARADAAGLDARDRLTDNDGYGFFAALGDLVVTGPTLTNVNDFRAIVVDPLG